MASRHHIRLKTFQRQLGLADIADIEDLSCARKDGCTTKPTKGQASVSSCACAASRASQGSSKTATQAAREAVRFVAALPRRPRNALRSSVTSGSIDFGEDSLRTPEQYIASLRGRGLHVYLYGQKVAEFVDHPVIRPSINAVAETYRLAMEAPELASAVSEVSGVRTSRFLHVTTSAQDVVSQSHMQRELGRRTGTCFQRCVGMDATNSLYSTTFDVDAKHKTDYHTRFKTFLAVMQRKNYVLGGAMTDPKGDRSKSPSQQEDPDMFVRIVERRNDGIVLKGCKVHQTGCLNSHWLLLMPGGRLREQDRDYAVACAVPVDAKGITYVVGRQSCDMRSMEAGNDIDQGNAQFAGQEATVVFESVFVPNEYVFMNGETEFAAELVERFTAYHRRSYICKAGLGDVLLGAAGTIVDYNGVAKASHVKRKLVQIAYLNENIAATALAASHQSAPTASGNWQPDTLLANVCKHNVTRFPYEIARLAQDLAGGLMVTLPSNQDFENEVTGPLLRKYLVGRKGISVDNRRRILRLIENMTMGRNAVGYLTESMHGAGSPEAQRVMIGRLMDLDAKKKMAQRLAGIEIS